MIDVSKWDPSVLRGLNLKLFDDPRYEYDVDSGSQAPDAIRRRIRNVKDAKIRRLLAVVPDCPVGTEPGFKDWWAQWMPIAAGMQIWPDGNHRTGLMVAELVAKRAGFSIVLDEGAMEELRFTSKRIVQQRWKGNNPVKPNEFADVNHPLRRYYESFKGRLTLEKAP